MRTLASMLTATGLLCSGAALGAPASGDERVAVIVSASVAVSQLSAADVRELFLGRKQILAGDVPLQAIDNADKQARDIFYIGVAGMSGTRVRAYWARIVFSAQGRPPPELPASEVGRRVIERPGTLGYVDASNIPAGARVLFTFP
jgi:hypothetical protein